MGTITVTAPAKVNLHLEVLGLRTDGFHELAMVMQSIDLCDRLSVSNTADGQFHFSCDAPELSIADDNLVIRAARLLRARSGFDELGASIHLEKRIPIGAGLAGGSSDGAATLVALNALWGLGQSKRELETLAAELGSDMPFCIAGGTQLCFGRGETLEPLPAPADPLAVLLVKDPTVSVSTPLAYRRCREIRGEGYLSCEHDFEARRQILRQASWVYPIRSGTPPPLRNDLQDVVEPETVAVQTGLRLLNSLKTTLAVAMSGSGPSCFALFKDLASSERALEVLRSNLDQCGLKAWCCALRSEGARIES